MRWVITFLHNDAEAEEVEVDENTLVEAFDAAIRRDCPAHVIDVSVIPDEGGAGGQGILG